MKIVALILFLGLLVPPGFGQCKTDFIFLGNVSCLSKKEYPNATEKAYKIHYVNTSIDQSHYSIDIELYQASYPFFVNITARLYRDSAFRLYYITRKMLDDGDYSKGDTSYPPPTLNLDTLFSKLVASGIFSLPMISTTNLRKNWEGSILSATGKFKKNAMSTVVSDGDQYILTTKVSNCYRQCIFDNPDIYSKFYVDNPTFKRQDAIVKVIMSGYQYQ